MPLQITHCDLRGTAPGLSEISLMNSRQPRIAYTFSFTTPANFLLLQKALAVWSPVGESGNGEQNQSGTSASNAGEKSPESPSAATATSPTVSSSATTESAAGSSNTSAATMAVTGTQAAGPFVAQWMSAVMAEHMADTPYVAWPNGMEVGHLLMSADVSCLFTSKHAIISTFNLMTNFPSFVNVIQVFHPPVAMSYHFHFSGDVR